MLTSDVVPDFTGLRVAVVGDLIADHYIYAEPSRLSREAPVLVMRHVTEEIRSGGSANVARNLWALGAQTRVIGTVASDRNGRELLSMLESESIDVDGIQSIPGWVTPTKTRVLGADPRRTMQQLLRIDREPDKRLPSAARRGLAERVGALEGQVDAVILSDYTYGAISREVVDAARVLRRSGIYVVLDPRGELFAGMTAITPNLSELAALTGRRQEELVDREEITEAAHALMERAYPELLLVTLGNQGMTVFGRELPRPGVSVDASGGSEIIDVSGAGDTAVAAFSLALASGLDVERAMRLANAASGVVVMENGTAVCSLSKLRSALPHAPVPRRAEVVAG